MTIFISWSGAFSECVALALDSWLKLIFNPITVFVSSVSIDKGTRWQQELAKQLAASNFGIACLTPDNLKAPWIIFETGALSKLPESSLWTLLLGGLKWSDFGDNPLAVFQHTTFEKKDVFKLLRAINEVQKDNKRDEASLQTLFDTFWPRLEDAVKLAANKQEGAPVPTRKVEDMVRELLEVTNTIARNMPKTLPARNTSLLGRIGAAMSEDANEVLWRNVMRAVLEQDSEIHAKLRHVILAQFWDNTLTLYVTEEFSPMIQKLLEKRGTSGLLQSILGEEGCGFSCHIEVRTLQSAVVQSVPEPPKKY